MNSEKKLSSRWDLNSWPSVISPDTLTTQVDVIPTFKIPYNTHFEGWLVAFLLYLNVSAQCS